MHSRITTRLTSMALQADLYLRRGEAKKTKLQVARLERFNQRSLTPVTASSGPVVSVTSYGDRLRSVHLALESIAAGSIRPSRLILWVDTPEALAHCSPGIERLMKRGLEVRLSNNFGPHTKYYPYLLATSEFAVPLVTADDDQIYSTWWLRGLMESYLDHPNTVSCYRAHVMRLNGVTLEPYRRWAPCTSTDPSLLHFATGVSGCIYSPSLLRQLKAAGTEFLQSCPKADDVWLHVHALRAGMKTRQIWDRPLRFPFVPGTQDIGLYHSNVLQAGNDEQIEKTYTVQDIQILREAASGRKSRNATQS